MKVQDLLIEDHCHVENLRSIMPTPPPSKDQNDDNIKKFQCSHADCGKIFTRLQNLNSHLSVHSGERPFICKYDGCQGKFRRKQDLFRHTRSIHMPFASRPYQCPTVGCLMRFARADGLSAHLRSCVSGKKKNAFAGTSFSDKSE